jgi:hypothetical protein
MQNVLCKGKHGATDFWTSHYGWSPYSYLIMYPLASLGLCDMSDARCTVYIT